MRWRETVQREWRETVQRLGVGNSGESGGGGNSGERGKTVGRKRKRVKKEENSGVKRGKQWSRKGRSSGKREKS